MAPRVILIGIPYFEEAGVSQQTLGTVTTTYGYASGNNLQATESVGGALAETYGYTADGSLAAVDSGSAALATYTYDGFGQRALKTTSGATGSIYKYSFNGQLLEEQNSSGVAEADYIYLNGQPIAVLNGSTLYYLHDDHLGTPQLATSTTQSVTSQANYQPFGAASVTGTITQNLRLPGQSFDLESGWNHNGFRDYMPTAGRYLEPDPLGFAGSGTNLYAYAGNSPANFTDPYGLKLVVTGDQTDYQLAIQYLEASPIAKAIIIELENAQEVYTVDPFSLPLKGSLAWSPNTVGNQYERAKRVIDWDPHAAQLCRSGGKQSPALGLIHELYHAIQQRRGLPSYFDPKFDTNWERDDILGPETAIAKLLGEGTRNDHMGDYYWVQSPTAR